MNEMSMNFHADLQLQIYTSIDTALLFSMLMYSTMSHVHQSAVRSAVGSYEYNV